MANTESTESNKVTIYSYAKVWNVEKKVYSFSNIPLPRPVNPYDFIIFMAVAGGIFLLGKIFPVIVQLPAVIRFVAIPYGIANYLMKMKLDGKNPFKYLWGCMWYFFTVRGSYLQQFKKYPDKKERIALKWNCSMGVRQ